MNRKSIVKALVSGALFVAMAAGMAAADVRQMSLGHTGQDMNIFSKAAKMFGELVEKESAGAMKVNVIGAGALGNNREGIEQVLFVTEGREHEHRGRVGCGGIGTSARG